MRVWIDVAATLRSAQLLPSVMAVFWLVLWAYLYLPCFGWCYVVCASPACFCAEAASKEPLGLSAASSCPRQGYSCSRHASCCAAAMCICVLSTVPQLTYCGMAMSMFACGVCVMAAAAAASAQPGFPLSVEADGVCGLQCSCFCCLHRRLIHVIASPCCYVSVPHKMVPHAPFVCRYPLMHQLA
jgi:hypothetical protein